MSLAADRADAVVHLRSLLRERFPGAHRRPSPAASSASSPFPSPFPSPSPSDPPASFPAGLDPIPSPPSPPSPPRFVPDFPLGVDLLDGLDGGRGLTRGCVAEIVARRRDAGAGVLIGGLIQAAGAGPRPYPLALIDGADSLDPASLGDTPGTAADLCRRLLWVRCRHRVDHAIKAADLLLRDGNLPVVLLDLQLCRLPDLRRGIPGGVNSWYRLRSLAERSGVILLAFLPEPAIPSPAWRLELDQRWSLDAIDRLPQTGDLRREPIRHRLTRAPAAGVTHATPLARAG